MKKRRGSLLQRMMAVLFAAVLTAGMVSDVVSAGVPVQEGSAAESLGNEGTESETISTNDTEPASVAEPQSVMTAAAPAPQADNIASGNGWALDADGKLTISSDAGMEDWGNYMRGDYIYYAQQVVNVEIQDGVTSLGNNAFYNYGELTGITIADSVTSIAGSAFSGCWKLRKITIPNNVTSISDRMFMNSGLEEITIPGSVTSIGEFAFWGCGLTKITIPASVQSIGEKAFIYCDNLNEVIIKSETPPTLGDGVFTDCGFVENNTKGIRVPEGKAQAYKDAWTDWADYIADGTMTEKYTVTVSGGTGGGEYEAGTTVTITADDPASGKSFDKWVVNSGSVTLADSTNSTTTFTMPAGAVSVTATYKDKTGGDTQGSVTPEVKPGANAPATDISTPAEELKDMLLTDEEKQQVQNGTNIRIVLEVQDAGNTVSSSDKEAVAQALNGFTVGQYLNIDLYKLAEAERTDIHETAKKIKIVIAVPEALRNADSSKTRTFAVVRVHDGRAELLADLDGSADTITIETDRFSTYAIVYQDTANGGGGNNGNDNNNGGGGNNGNDNNNGGGNDNGGSGNNGNGNGNGGSGNNSGNNGSGNNNSGQNNSGINNTKTGSAKDNEPATGDAAPLEIYATLAMIAGFSYVLLYFTDRKRGMTEETKRELVSRLVGWAKQGGRIRKYLALAAVFVLLVYYHSIGKKTCAEWKEIYGE